MMNYRFMLLVAMAMLFFAQCKNTEAENAAQQTADIAVADAPDTFVLNNDISKQTGADAANEPKPEPSVGFDVPDFYKGADGSVLLVRYIANEGSKKVGLTFQGTTKEVLIDQVPGTEFAKGADYKGQGITWQAKGDAGVLIKDGKTINFTKD